uniref:Uncharacterized protein n=1 Tax=Human betaherpesvirus 6 TaxID=10368 RepID=A0A5P9U5Y7_9BETA|nr:hypothetical protein [Human betaherpesvirus 6]
MTEYGSTWKTEPRSTAWSTRPSAKKNWDSKASLAS